MNYSMIKIVEVLNKIFTKVVTEILEFIILGFYEQKLKRNQACSFFVKTVIFKALV